MKEGREATGSRGGDVGFEHSAMKEGREATGSRGADVGFEHSTVKEGREAKGSRGGDVGSRDGWDLANSVNYKFVVGLMIVYSDIGLMQMNYIMLQ